MPSQFHSSLAAPFNQASSLYQLQLKGGCTLLIPVKQPSHITDQRMKELLSETFAPFLDNSTS